jgi:hypothetical protein
LSKKNPQREPGIVARAYNPRYLGGGDQKDYDLGPVWAKS